MTIETHQINLPFSDSLREFVDQRVRASLRRHIDRVGRVVVRLTDIGGPRGGAADKVCRLHVELDAEHALVSVGESDDVYTAVRDAAARLGRVVDRKLGHRLGHRLSRRERAVR